MQEFQTFLIELRMAYDDPTTCLIFADWLEEQGDPRGHFLRSIAQNPQEYVSLLFELTIEDNNFDVTTNAGTRLKRMKTSQLDDLISVLWDGIEAEEEYARTVALQVLTRIIQTVELPPRWQSELLKSKRLSDEISPADWDDLLTQSVNTSWLLADDRRAYVQKLCKTHIRSAEESELTQQKWDELLAVAWREDRPETQPEARNNWLVEFTGLHQDSALRPLQVALIRVLEARIPKVMWSWDGQAASRRLWHWEYLFVCLNSSHAELHEAALRALGGPHDNARFRERLAITVQSIRHCSSVMDIEAEAAVVYRINQMIQIVWGPKRSKGLTATIRREVIRTLCSEWNYQLRDWNHGNPGALMTWFWNPEHADSSWLDVESA